jgi:hypothetical protein
MLVDIFKEGKHRNYHRVRPDQIRYFNEKYKKRKFIRIKFGSEIAQKAGIFKGEHLRVQWDDKSRQLLINKSETGFVVIHTKGQYPYIHFPPPKGIKLPEVNKTFTNFEIKKDMIILDFYF